MNNVTELNKLAEKITGTNPNATIDAKAVKFIADNYNGGNGNSDYLIQMEGEQYVNNYVLITNEDIIAKLEKIYNDFFVGGKVVLPELIYITNAEYDPVLFSFKDCNIIHDSDEGRYNINFGLSYPTSATGMIVLYGVTFSRENENEWYLRTKEKTISKNVT